MLRSGSLNRVVQSPSASIAGLLSIPIVPTSWGKPCLLSATLFMSLVGKNWFLRTSKVGFLTFYCRNYLSIVNCISRVPYDYSRCWYTHPFRPHDTFPAVVRVFKFIIPAWSMSFDVQGFWDRWSWTWRNQGFHCAARLQPYLPRPPASSLCRGRFWKGRRRRVKHGRILFVLVDISWSLAVHVNTPAPLYLLWTCLLKRS